MDFLYHKLSEKDKEEIKKQVQGILDSFSKKLAQIKEPIKEQTIEREISTRKEIDSSEKINEKKENIIEFSKKKMFENAPNKNDDFIIAEKKKW